MKVVNLEHIEEKEFVREVRCVSSRGAVCELTSVGTGFDFDPPWQGQEVKVDRVAPEI